jgi:hypothetical protein
VNWFTELLAVILISALFYELGKISDLIKEACGLLRDLEQRLEDVLLTLRQR